MRWDHMAEVAKAVLIKVVFLVMCMGGITVIWNLSSPIPDLSILFGLAWVVITSKVLRWFVIHIGWSTAEREGGRL
jgi:hypothetical protein